MKQERQYAVAGVSVALDGNRLEIRFTHTETYLDVLWCTRAWNAQPVPEQLTISTI